MKKIIRPHGTNKTNELIKYASENDYVIISENPQNTLIKAAVLGCNIKGSYSYMDLYNDRVHEDYYVIDDLEAFLNFILDKPPVAITLATD